MDLDKQSYSTCINCISRQERFYGFLKFMFRINFLDLQKQCIPVLDSIVEKKHEYSLPFILGIMIFLLVALLVILLFNTK